jgi:hypothetical protein
MRMRKRIIHKAAQRVTPTDQPWLDVEPLAQIEITSEDPAHPIEAALRPGSGSGWQAADPGEQTIRLLFDAPLRLRQIRVVFQEDELARTQEFTLGWSPDGGRSYHQVVRQQYTFSPPGTTREVEDYAVDLDGVTTLELHIIPDISGGAVPASLVGWYMIAT